MIPAKWFNLGRMEYQRAWDTQKFIQERQLSGAQGPVVLTVEHPPTITIGRRGQMEDLVAPLAVLERRGIAVIETDRGGQITYHGPGQLVVYPLVNIQELGLDTHGYMRALEESVIQYLASLDLKGYRVQDRTGVWVGKDKICAMGIRVRKWWALHGLALNITTDLNHFGMIIPCGIRDRGVTTLEKLLGPHCPDYETVQTDYLRCLGEQLGIELTQEQDNTTILQSESEQSHGN